MDVGLSVENDGTHHQVAAEERQNCTWQSVPEAEPREVNYSIIDFTKWNGKSPSGTEDKQNTTETEYAEIQRDEAEERQENAGEDGQMWEGNDEVAAVLEKEVE